MLPKSYQTSSSAKKGIELEPKRAYSRKFWLSIVASLAILTTVGYYSAYNKKSEDVNTFLRVLDEKTMDVEMEEVSFAADAVEAVEVEADTLDEDYVLVQDVTLQKVSGPFGTTAWQNAWDGPLNVNFPGPMCAVRSIHDNGREDRLFNIRYCMVDPAPGWGPFQSMPTTNWDAPWTVECPSGSFMRGVYSYHDNGREDRRWTWKCAKYGVANPSETWVHANCIWSGYNNWDSFFDMRCPTDKMIAGASSYHDNGKEDRRFRWKCCGVTKTEGGPSGPGTTGPESVSSPVWTGYVNNWDAPLNVMFPNPMCGASSYHDNSKEDRRWRFATCNVASNLGFSGPMSLQTTDWDAQWTRECPSGFFLVGAYSYHDNSKEDRRWTWKCAKYGVKANPPGTWVSANCMYTAYNNWDAAFTTVCPSGKVLAGVSSYHDNGKEDRRYRWKCCTIMRTG